MATFAAECAPGVKQSSTPPSGPGALDAVLPYGIRGGAALLDGPVHRAPVCIEAFGHLDAAELLVVANPCRQPLGIARVVRHEAGTFPVRVGPSGPSIQGAPFALGASVAGPTIGVQPPSLSKPTEVIVSNWADLTNGKRIKHLRGSDLTQQGLADAAGVSLALVQKAEQDRGELSVGSLLKLASALKSDVAVILGQQAPRQGMNRDDRAALRHLSDSVHESALGEWDGIDDPSTLDELTRARDLAWSAYWASDTAKVSNLASKVLMEGQVRYASATGAEREQLALVLASTYRVAASCANGFGQRDLA